jgi:hypothetical protein
MDIKLRFGEMFVKHMVGVIDDFKDLLQTEFDNINQMEEKCSDDDMVVKDKKIKKVQKNIPKPLNKEKGLLKDKKSKSKKKKLEEPTGLPDGLATIHPAHENFNMVFNIMLGIKKAVDSTFDMPLLNATDKDFHLKC